MDTLPPHDKIDVIVLEKILSDRYLTLSYKLFWFKAVVDLVEMGEQEIPFRKIVYEMIAAAWYMVTEYKLKLGYLDNLYAIIEYIHSKYELPSIAKRTEILELLNNSQDDEIEKLVNTLFHFVPYRLISPFYEYTLRGLVESKKNLTIVELSYSDKRAIYRIDLMNKKILVNDIWMNYIKENYSILQGWIHYKMIRYLQKKNPNVPAIPFKIWPPYKRDLHQAKKFWSEVAKEIPLWDIYIREPMQEENFSRFGPLSIDHFIPWSFLMHDEIWNLLPTFRNVNSMKSNLLPNFEQYFDRFCDIQYRAFRVAGKNKALSKVMEDYMNIESQGVNGFKLGNENISQEEFAKGMYSTIFPLHQIASNQGFGVWTYEG